MNRRTLFLFSPILLALLTGCPTNQYSSKSTLFSDGRMERSIYQPVDETPRRRKRRKLWQSKEVVKHKGGRDYIKASGTFAAVKDVPDTLSVQRRTENKLLSALMPAGKLKRLYEKNDYVFVTEHRWTETLTDTVTITSLRQGREELAVLALDLGESVFNEVLGKDYDAAELFKWAN